MGSQRGCCIPLQMLFFVFLIATVQIAEALQWITDWNTFNPRTGVGIQLQWADNDGPVTIAINTVGAESSRSGKIIVSSYSDSTKYIWTPDQSLASGQYYFMITDASGTSAIGVAFNYVQTSPPAGIQPAPSSPTGDSGSPDTSPTNNSSSGGLTVEQKIGIGIGAGAGGLILMALFSYCFYQRGMRNEQFKSRSTFGLPNYTTTEPDSDLHKESPLRKPPVALYSHHGSGSGIGVGAARSSSPYGTPRQHHHQLAPGELPGSTPLQQRQDANGINREAYELQTLANTPEIGGRPATPQSPRYPSSSKPPNASPRSPALPESPILPRSTPRR